MPPITPNDLNRVTLLHQFATGVYVGDDEGNTYLLAFIDPEPSERRNMITVAHKSKIPMRFQGTTHSILSDFIETESIQIQNKWFIEYGKRVDIFVGFSKLLKCWYKFWDP